MNRRDFLLTSAAMVATGVVGEGLLERAAAANTKASAIDPDLTPAEVLTVTVDENGAKSCRAIVPDSQLSLAIGNKGQNVRLAAKLTGWKIDINPETQTDEVIDYGI